MAASIHIPIGEYMLTTYRPDREYVDGELLERNVGKKEHARLQALLAAWFFNHEREWTVTVFTEQRVQVSPTRVRIPDVTLVRPGPLPEVPVDPPLLVIEIVSPDDSYGGIANRCRDYTQMGIETTWIIDPDHRAGHQHAGPSWRERAVLDVPGTPIFVPLREALWDDLDRTTAP
jgi:Uma2 family endonuclease